MKSEQYFPQDYTSYKGVRIMNGRELHSNKRYYSKVRFLNFFDLGVEEFEFSNLKHAEASKDLILKTLRPIWRPFCTVRFVEQ